MRTFLLTAFAASVLAGCSSMTDTRVDLRNLGVETEEEYREMRAEMIADLDAAIGQAAAASEQACGVLEVGEKPCGGPAEHRVYSSADGDTDRILGLADEITDLDRSANTAFGLQSTCDVERAPQPVLDEGRCVVASAR